MIFGVRSPPPCRRGGEPTADGGSEGCCSRCAWSVQRQPRMFLMKHRWMGAGLEAAPQSGPRGRLMSSSVCRHPGAWRSNAVTARGQAIDVSRGTDEQPPSLSERRSLPAEVLGRHRGLPTTGPSSGTDRPLRSSSGVPYCRPALSGGDVPADEADGRPGRRRGEVEGSHVPRETVSHRWMNSGVVFPVEHRGWEVGAVQLRSLEWRSCRPGRSVWAQEGGGTP